MSRVNYNRDSHLNVNKKWTDFLKYYLKWKLRTSLLWWIIPYFIQWILFNAEFFMKSLEIMTFLASSFRFIWIPMLWVYGHYKYFNSYSVGIDFVYRCQISMTKVYPRASSSARLAIPEVVDRPCWNRVESAYWSGDSLKIFFLFDPSLTSGMSVVLMWGHCLWHRPHIKQHMSAGRAAHRKRLRHRPPHLTETCVRVELMVSQRRRQRASIKKTFFWKTNEYSISKSSSLPK